MIKAKPFRGKDNAAEERSEARMVRAGRVSPAEYARREKAEGEKASFPRLKAVGQKLASGKMSASKYASKASKKER